MKKVLPIGWGILLIAIGLTLAVPMITASITPIITIIGAVVAAVVILRVTNFYLNR